MKAQVLEIDAEKRRMRLGMKQLIPTSLDEYIAEHKEGEVVTGRMSDVSATRAKVELGEGVYATCRLGSGPAPEEEAANSSKVDLSSMTSMLAAKWKSGEGGGIEDGIAALGPGAKLPDCEVGRGGEEDRSRSGVKPAFKATPSVLPGSCSTRGALCCLIPVTVLMGNNGKHDAGRA